MTKILKLLWIIQQRKHKDHLGDTYYKNRLNPINPFSYITVVLVILIGLLMFGIIGFWRETDLRNPFRWQ